MDGLAEVSGDFGERGNEKISEVVPLEAFAGAEAMGKEPGQQVAFLGQRHHAIAQVAGREHVEVFSEPAGGTPIIGDCHHRCQIADLASLRG